MRLSQRVGAAVIAATLSIVVGCAVVPDPQRLGSYVDDATITTRIRSDIVADRNIDAEAIHVETLDGTVTLSGVARSPLQKMAVESIAMKVNGAKQIRNEIAVRP